MKLWELFDEKYIGEKVKYTNLTHEECIARIQRTISGCIALFPNDSSSAIRFTQCEMQNYDFEIIRKQYTLEELSGLDLNETMLKLEFDGESWRGTMTHISELLSAYCSSQECYDAITKGKWYIVD